MTNTVHPELPDTAMVLAAGYGKRLQPLTLTCPKPMVPVAERPLIDHALERLTAAGITRVVVNTHYLPEQIEEHLAKRTDLEVVICREEELLDTGGGVLNALAHLGPGPVLVTNSDMIWENFGSSSLQRLGQAWKPEQMDALLLVQPVVNALGYLGAGDFRLSPGGRLTRRQPGRVTPFLFTGIQLLDPALFEGMTVEPFSLNRLYDRAAENDRLFGIRHDGVWVDVGHPEGLEAAERLLTGQV